MNDKRDIWTPMIEASHPLRTGAHDAYAVAMEMVGNRNSKGALVDLVCWLVQRADAAEESLRECRRRNDAIANAGVMGGTDA